MQTYTERPMKFHDIIRQIPAIPCRVTHAKEYRHWQEEINKIKKYSDDVEVEYPEPSAILGVKLYGPHCHLLDWCFVDDIVDQKFWGLIDCDVCENEDKRLSNIKRMRVTRCGEDYFVRVVGHPGMTLLEIDGHEQCRAPVQGNSHDRIYIFLNKKQPEGCYDGIIDDILL